MEKVRTEKKQYHVLRLCQKLAGSVAAAGIDLVPLVEGGGGRLEHDVELLFEAQATEP